jgi:hypothetical protein
VRLKSCASSNATNIAQIIQQLPTRNRRRAELVRKIITKVNVFNAIDSQLLVLGCLGSLLRLILNKWLIQGGSFGLGLFLWLLER